MPCVTCRAHSHCTCTHSPRAHHQRVNRGTSLHCGWVRTEVRGSASAARYCACYGGGGLSRRGRPRSRAQPSLPRDLTPLVTRSTEKNHRYAIGYAAGSCRTGRLPLHMPIIYQPIHIIGNQRRMSIRHSFVWRPNYRMPAMKSQRVPCDELVLWDPCYVLACQPLPCPIVIDNI